MAIVAIASVGLAIYSSFVYEKRGELTISIDAVSRVFDVHQTVGGLEISYGGQDLRAVKKALWSVTFRITNSGNAEIKKGDFDDLVPFGLKFEGGELVETPTIKANVNYLSHNLRLTTKPQSVSLTPIIFEPRDEVQISLLLLGPEANKPIMVPMGKIAGMRSIPISSPDDRIAGRSWWTMITEADTLWVHAARMVVYGVGGLLAIVVIALAVVAVVTPFDKMMEKYKTVQRRKAITNYRANEALDGNSRQIVDLYIRKGPSAMREINSIIKRVKQRDTLIAAIADKFDVKQLQKILRAVAPVYANSTIFNEIKSLGLVTDSESKITLADGLEETVRSLCEFLKLDLSIRPGYRPSDTSDFYAMSDLDASTPTDIEVKP